MRSPLIALVTLKIVFIIRKDVDELDQNECEICLNRMGEFARTPKPDKIEVSRTVLDSRSVQDG